MKNNLKKYELVIILCFLAAGLSIIKMVYGYKGGNSREAAITDTITPTSEPTPTSPTTQIAKLPTGEIKPTNFEDKDFPLWNLLPYVGRGFIVDRYTKPLTLAIKVKGIDKKIIEKDVNDWIVSNGEASGSHKLVFEQ